MLAYPVFAEGDPFRITDSGNLRADLTADWAGFSTVHEAQLPDFAAVPTSVPGSNLLALGVSSEIRIWNQSGLNQSGVLLTSSGPGTLFLYPPQVIQGFGLTVEHFNAGPATTTLSIYRDSGQFLATKTISVADGRVPTYIGIIDPDAETKIIGIHSSGGGKMALSNPSMQYRIVPETDPSKLTAAASVTEEVNPLDTYFNQGFGNRTADAATLTATTSNENVHDLLAWFPGLRAGDVLGFQRLGSPLGTDGKVNPLLGVISSSEVLEEGTAFRRVPGAIKAGFGFHTQPVSSDLRVRTPSNLPEDFIIGASSYAVVPPGARYLFLSRETPGANLPPLSVKVNHIQRKVFESWVQERGLVGSLADPNGDADGDGLTLIEEFAFSKNPMRSDSASREDFSFAPFVDETSAREGRLTMRLGARRDGPVSYQAQVSDDLSNWTTLPPGSISTLLEDGQADGRAVLGFSASSTGQKRFGRLQLNFIPPTNP